MNVLALCAGIGGLELGLRLAEPRARAVCYVEREAYAAAVLAARMADGAVEPAPIWSSLESFDGERWRGVVDCITAGFPCQPWSAAGKRLGVDDDRWIWPEIVRIVREVEPGLVFLENVPGLLHGGLERVLRSLAVLGFDAEWGLFSAAEVGAPHLRKRLFILAVSSRRGLGELRQSPEPAGLALGGSEELADREHARLYERRAARDRDGRDAPGDEPHRCDPDLGNPERSRWPTTGTRGRLDAGAESEARGGVLADAERGRHDGRAHEPEQGSDRGAASESAGAAVADAAGSGPSLRGSFSGDGREERAPAERGGTPLVADPCGGTGREYPGVPPRPEAGTNGRHQPGRHGRVPVWPPAPNDRAAWASTLERAPDLEPAVRRVADGIPHRMDRLRALGNGVVPDVAARAWQELMARLAC